MMTVLLLLVLGAFGCTVASAIGKCPLWIPMILICVVEMLRVLPLGR